MILRHARPFRLAFVLLALLAVSAASCSSKGKVVKPVTTSIAQADADDIVQLLATTLASDHGGWYCTVKAVCETLAVPAPVRLTSAGGGARAVQVSARSGNLGSFSFERGGVTYLMQNGWVRADGSVTGERDTSSRSLMTLISVDDGAFNNINGINGTYGLHTYALNSPIDSTFLVSNISAVSPDTLEFSGFLDDSSFSTVQSSVRTPTPAARLWYHTNFVDYTLRILKSRLLSAPYPVGSDSEIHWTIQAYAMRGTPDRTDFAYDYLIQGRMNFDGSAEGVLTLSELAAAPSWSYVYKVNLNTGQIARLN